MRFPRRVSTHLLGSFAVFCAVAARPALADEPPQPPIERPSAQADENHSRIAPAIPAAEDEEQLKRLTGLLKQLSSPWRDSHVWMAVSSLALGAIATPLGVVVLDRSEPEDAEPGSIILGVGIGAILVSGITALEWGPNPFKQLADVADAEQKTGKPAGEIVQDLETQWRAMADISRSNRRIGGILAIGLGALAVAGGTYLALGDVSSVTFSKKEQYGWSAALMAYGIFANTFGWRAFLFEEPVETSWETYESQKPQRGTVLKLNGIGGSPVAGGGVLTLGGSF